MSFMVLLMAIMVFFMGFSICFWGFYGLSVLGGGGQEMCLVPESRLSWSGGFGAGGFPAEQEPGVGDTLVPFYHQRCCLIATYDQRHKFIHL